MVVDDIASSDDDEEEKMFRSLFIHVRFLVKPSCENERDCNVEDRDDCCLDDCVDIPVIHPPVGEFALLCCSDIVVDGLNNLDVDEGDENASIT